MKNKFTWTDPVLFTYLGHTYPPPPPPPKTTTIKEKEAMNFKENKVHNMVWKEEREDKNYVIISQSKIKKEQKNHLQY